MRASPVARSYADALLELAGRQGEEQAFAAAFERLIELQADARVRAFLETPKIDVDAKKRVLRTALAGQVPPVFLNFLLVVLDKRRQRLLGEIALAYRELLDEKLGLLNVEVTVAHELDERGEEEVALQLSRILGRRVLPHLRVDPAILGGIIVRYGDRVLDGSLRRRLVSLRRRLLGAGLEGVTQEG